MAEPPAESGSPSNKSSARLSAEDRIGLYRTMTLIREFEEQVHRSYLEGLVHGTTHLCNGQEAVSAGVAKALREDDYVSYTYRGHGQCLARGMDLEAAFAELFGRDTGVCGGLGGSMHLTDIDRGLIGAFGIVGAGLPVAVGAGVSAQLAGRKQVSVCFFGDGATNIGAFHEAMNMAQVWKLPVIFVCENNLIRGVQPYPPHDAVREPRHPRRRLLHANRTGRWQRRSGCLRRCGAGDLARARRRGTYLHRVQDLSPSRPFAHRPGQVSPSNRGRGLVETRSDLALPSRARRRWRIMSTPMPKTSPLRLAPWSKRPQIAPPLPRGPR